MALTTSDPQRSGDWPAPRLIVLTGGPGAGKTALLELIRKAYPSHVTILPEAASLVFGGGFPRDDHFACRRAAQRAIYHVQRALESVAHSHRSGVAICDRGTLDGLAYWPGPDEEFWTATGTTFAEQLSRYHAVIHLRTPEVDHGYNHQNPLRIESAALAAQIDERILQIWQPHPRRVIIPSADDFLAKCAAALRVVEQELPEGWRHPSRLGRS